MKRFTAATAVLLILATGLPALTWTHWSLDAGFDLVINSQLPDAGDGAIKEPLDLQFTPGASFHLEFDPEPGGWYFRPGGWLSWTIEEVYSGIARPCDEAENSHMKVLGLMADGPFGYMFTTEKVNIGIQGGPALYLRFPLYTAQEGDGDPAEFWAAYYGGAQFLHVSFASWVSIPLVDSLGGKSGTDILIGLRFYYPVSNLWTEAPLMHTARIGLTAALQF